MKQQQNELKWRKKLNDFKNGKIKRMGSAEIFINIKSGKISLKKGSKRWMKTIIQPILKIFKERVVTTGYVESKHHQIKSFGSRRKQIDKKYSHELFTICGFIADNEYLPPTHLRGRPLFKYLTKVTNRKKIEYVFCNNHLNSIQTTLSMV